MGARSRGWHAIVFLIGMFGSSVGLSQIPPGDQLVPKSPSDREPEARALEFLGREVPRWSRENRCFSCHNNGDAARAILAMPEKLHVLPADVMKDTLAFLVRPEQWDRNGVDAAFSDKRLARIQFAAALNEAVAVGRIKDREAQALAAKMVAKDQADDGSWPIDDAAPVGSPTTYGPPLATATAIRILRETDRDLHKTAIENGLRWMRARPIVNIHEASAVLLTLTRETPDDREKRAKAIELLRRGQNEDGGWGPFLRSASEPFDTALALIALGHGESNPATEARMRRGRDSLIASQARDGSWRETTRPPGGESYAQRISTTGWATQALLKTRLTATKPP